MVEIKCPKCGGHTSKHVGLVNGQEKEVFVCEKGCLQSQFDEDPEMIGLDRKKFPFTFTIKNGKHSEVYYSIRAATK